MQGRVGACCAHALGDTKPPGTSTLRARGSMAEGREVDLWRKEFEFTELLRASTQALGWDRGLQVTPPIVSTAQGASTLNWGALVTWGSVAQAEERGHRRGSEGAHEIRNYNYNNGNSVSS